MLWCGNSPVKPINQRECKPPRATPEYYLLLTSTQKNSVQKCLLGHVHFYQVFWPNGLVFRQDDISYCFIVGITKSANRYRFLQVDCTINTYIINNKNYEICSTQLGRKYTDTSVPQVSTCSTKKIHVYTCCHLPNENILEKGNLGKDGQGGTTHLQVRWGNRRQCPLDREGSDVGHFQWQFWNIVNPIKRWNPTYTPPWY